MFINALVEKPIYKRAQKNGTQTFKNTQDCVDSIFFILFQRFKLSVRASGGKTYNLFWPA